MFFNNLHVHVCLLIVIDIIAKPQIENLTFSKTGHLLYILLCLMILDFIGIFNRCYTENVLSGVPIALKGTSFSYNRALSRKKN